MTKANPPCDPAFGQVLRQARKELGKTQAEIAALARIAPEFYGRIERGEALGSLPTFATLRRILGFDANDLVMAMDLYSVRVRRRRGRPVPHRLAQDISGPHKVFASELAQARRRRRYMQETLAEAVECSAGFFMRIECGHALPSMQLFARLHHCLDFDANRLLDALHEAPPPRPRYYRLGVFITESRERAGQTIEAAAQAAGCSVEEYEGIEAGARRPTLTELTGLHGLLRFCGNAALRRIRLCEDDPAQSAATPSATAFG